MIGRRVDIGRAMNEKHWHANRGGRVGRVHVIHVKVPLPLSERKRPADRVFREDERCTLSSNGS
ncbi:MAG TPA: hypothetical protein VKB50_02405, partial [Vicinamibacterales bacterium]|nr:hypothetical protein [Vicinamibacterales bacterium]